MTLKATGLVKRLSGRAVLDGVSLDVGSGEIAVIHGENGAGKSTLLRVLGGLLLVDQGEVMIDGFSLASEAVRAKSRMGYVPDSTDAFPELRVGEFLALVTALKRPFAATASAGPPEDIVAALKVRTFWHQPIASLSFGQRKRMCTVAALIGDPWLLLVDEPSNGLDPEGVSVMVELLRQRQRNGQGTVASTNDEVFARDALNLGGTRYVIRDGRLERSPSP